MLTLTGGQSNFSLGWDEPAQQQQPKKCSQQSSCPWATDEEEKKTSVKVHTAPGGQSSIFLGDGTSENRFMTSSQHANQQAQNNLDEQPVQPEKKEEEKDGAVKTSVKIHNPPGGKSNIFF